MPNNSDKCVSCGSYVPEGTMVCKACYHPNHCLVCGAIIADDEEVCVKCEFENHGGVEKNTTSKKHIDPKDFNKKKKHERL